MCARMCSRVRVRAFLLWPSEGGLLWTAPPSALSRALVPPSALSRHDAARAELGLFIADGTSGAVYKVRERTVLNPGGATVFSSIALIHSAVLQRAGGEGWPARSSASTSPTTVRTAQHSPPALTSTHQHSPGLRVFMFFNVRQEAVALIIP